MARSIFSILCFLQLTFPLLAHEGHGHTQGHSLVHYMTEPVHLAGILSAALVTLLLLRWRGNRMKNHSGKDA